MSQTSFDLPLMLLPDSVNKLNGDILDRTGCIAFLDTERVVLSDKPASAKDAFTSIVMGLYIMYHDNGKALNTLLNDDMTPDGIKINTLRISREHIKRIKKLRTNLAHGLLLLQDRNLFKRIVAVDYLGQPELATPSWQCFLDSLAEDQWQDVVEQITQESDQLYSLLDTWSQKWEPKKMIVKPLFREKLRNAPLFSKDFCRQQLLALKQQPRQYEDKYERWQDIAVNAFFTECNPVPEMLRIKMEETIREQTVVAKSTSTNISERYGFDISQLSPRRK